MNAQERPSPANEPFPPLRRPRVRVFLRGTTWFARARSRWASGATPLEAIRAWFR